MSCDAKKKDGAFDEALCRERTLSPLFNKHNCAMRGAECDSPYRVCRACSGQRWRRIGCIPKEAKPITPIVRSEADNVDILALAPKIGLCSFHYTHGAKADRFPPKRRPKVAPRKIYPDPPPVREENLFDLLGDEEQELPNTDSDWDSDGDIGIDLRGEEPAQPKLPVVRAEVKPPPRSVASPLPQPAASVRRQASTGELDDLIARLKSKPAFKGKLFADDEE